MTSSLSDMTMSSTTLINLNSTSNTVPQQYGNYCDLLWMTDCMVLFKVFEVTKWCNEGCKCDFLHLMDIDDMASLHPIL